MAYLYRLGFFVADGAAALIRAGGAWLVPLGLALALAVKWLVKFRDTLKGRMLLYSRRGLAILLSGRYWEPLGLVAVGLALPVALALMLPEWVWPSTNRLVRPAWWPVLAPPAWLVAALLGFAVGRWMLRQEGVQKHVPDAHAEGIGLGILAVLGGCLGYLYAPAWWPRRLSLPGPTGVALLAVSPVVLLLAARTAWKRAGRERIINFPGKNGGFAARNEVAQNEDAVVTIPILVSHRGSAQPWDTKTVSISSVAGRG